MKGSGSMAFTTAFSQNLTPGHHGNLPQCNSLWQLYNGWNTQIILRCALKKTPSHVKLPVLLLSLPKIRHWILGQSHVRIGVCIPVWCVCYCYTVTNRNCCTDLIIQLQPLGPFKVLCVIKAGINSSLWPSLLMTNYWQLFWRMASLHPVFSFILFSQLAPTQARRSRLHWHRNALSQMCLEMNLLSGWSFCTHACAPKGLSYRILEQIPAQGHTFYLCGLFNSAAEGGWMQGSARDRAKTLQSNRTPKFLKSHYVITHWLCSVCVCSWRWIIDLWQVMRAHINEGDLSLPPPSISPLLLPLHSHSCSPFCCNFPKRGIFSQSQTHAGSCLAPACLESLPPTEKANANSSLTGPSAALPETVYGPFLHERPGVGCWW